MGFFSKIKEWLTGGKSSNTTRASRSSGASRSTRSTRTTGSQYSWRGNDTTGYGTRNREEDEKERQRKEQEERTKALASISKSSSEVTSGVDRALAKLKEKSDSTDNVAKAKPSKVAPPKPKSAKQSEETKKKESVDPKEQARQDARKRLNNYIDKKKKERDDFNKATNNKYNPDVNGNDARIAMKNGDYMSDPNVEKFEIDHNPVATSVARGLLSASTLGGSELLAKNKNRTEIEDYYQKHKSKGGEVAGEIIGTIPTFMLGGGPAKEGVKWLGKKAAFKGVAKGAEKATEKATTKLAGKKAVQWGAKQLASKEAAKQGLKVASKEMVEQQAKKIAGKAVGAAVDDIVINGTIGGVYNLNRSIAESDNLQDFLVNNAVNVGSDYLLGGAINAVPLVAKPLGRAAWNGGKKLLGIGAKEAVEEAVETGTKKAGKELLEEGAEAGVKHADDVLKSADDTVVETAKKRKPVRKELRAYTKWENKAKTTSNIGELAEIGVKSTDDVAKTIEPPKAIESKVEPPAVKGEKVEPPALKGEKIEPPTITVDDATPKKLTKRRQEINKAISDFMSATDDMTPDFKPEKSNKAAEDFISIVDANKAELDNGYRDLLPIDGADSVKAEPPRPKDFSNADYISSSDEGARELIQEQLGAKKGFTDGIDDIPGVEPTREDKMLEHLSNEYANGDYLSPEMGKTEGRQGFPTLGVDMTRKDITRATGEVIESKPVATAEQRLSELKDYYKSHANESADELRSRAVSSYLNIASSDQSVKILQDMSKNGIFDYKPVHMKELVEKAGKYFENTDNVREFNSRVSKILDSTNHNSDAGLSVHEAPEFLTKLHYQMQMLEPHLESKPELMDLYQQDASLMQEILTSMGQTGAIQRHYVHLTPQGKVRDTTELYAKMLDGCAGFRLDYKDQLPSGYHERINWIKNLLLEDEEYSSFMKDILDNNGNEEALNLARMSAGDLINHKYATKSGLDLLQQWRISSMLTLPRTWIKNIENNAAAMPLDITAEAISNALEKHILKSKGFKEGEVALHSGFSPKAFLQSIASNPTDVDAKRAKETFNELYKDVLGADKYASGRKYKGRNIRGKVGKMWAVQKLNAGVNTWSDFISNVLSKGDLIFKEQIYRENYTKLCKRYRELGMTMDDAMYNRIDQEAFERALRNTYNNANSFAQMWNGAVRNFTNPDAKLSERAVGFAATTLNPFAKVSSNLTVRSFEYSPAGLVRGVINIEKAAKKGDALLMHQAITQMGKGITGGVGLFGLGMFSATVSDNLLVGDIGSSDPADKFMRQQGLQSYSAVLPINGNKYSFSLTDVSPDTGVFFMGYKFQQSLMNKDINVFDAGLNWAQLTTLIMEPTLNNSVFTATNSLLQTLRGNYGDDGDKSSWEIVGRELVQSYENSLIPAFIPALAKTMYKADKQLVGGDGSDEEYFKNQLKIKTGLAGDNPVTRALGIEQLGADTDAYGNYKNEKNSAGDYAHSFVKNFLAPATWQKVGMTDSDYAKVDKYKELVKSGVESSKADYMFPKKQTKNTFEIGDETVKMSPRDISLYNHAKTTGGGEAMRYVLDNPMFNRYKVEGTGKKTVRTLLDGYTKEQKKELIEQFEGKSMRDVEQWLEKQPQWKNASDAEKNKALSGMWTVTKGIGDGPSVGAKRVGEQAVYKAHGGDVNEYNFKNEVTDTTQEKLKPLIDSKVVSYEEAVDFYRDSKNVTYNEQGEKHVSTSGTSILAALEDSDLSEEQKKALFEATYTGKKTYEQYKAYAGKKGSGRRGYRRGYRRHGRRGGSSKAKVPSPKKITGLKNGVALTTKTASTSSKSKATAPTLKRVKAKIDLPTPRK